LTSQWLKKFGKKSKPSTEGLPLVVTLDGFLNAGNTGHLAAGVLKQNEIDVVHEFDADFLIDHRSRRPMIRFATDHFHGYRPHRLDITKHRDLEGNEYLLLSGPEPDYHWEMFVDELHDFIDENNVPLVLTLGGVPMGVPHTRPILLTAHGNRPELVDRPSLWDSEIQIPASLSSVLEFRLGEYGHDAAGYVAHVPHYLTGVDFPTAALELLEATGMRLNLLFNVEKLLIAEADTNAQIESQIDEQGGLDVLKGLEEQYDAYQRGAGRSLLADEDHIPSGEELADQFEQFLAQQTGDEQN